MMKASSVRMLPMCRGILSSVRRPATCSGIVVAPAASQQHRSVCSIAAATPIRCKDVRRHDVGESRRLSFDERAEKRAGKSRDQKQAREQILLEAEQFVDTEYPEDLEKAFEKIKERCTTLSLRILNITKCIECLEMDAPGAGIAPGGSTAGPKRKPLLLQVANVVKTKPNELEVTPTVASMSSAILSRIGRFDGSLQVTKDQHKIRVVIPPMTTARRDKAAADIKSQIVELKHKIKLTRQNAAKVLTQIGVDENTMRSHNETLDTKTSEFVEEKEAELEVIAGEIMTMGVDESDAGAQ